MKNLLAKVSPRQAAMAVGIAFITSVLIVSLVDDFLLANFVIPGDTAVLENDIAANGRLFGFAVIGYLLVLSLDSIIGLALYVVLKPASKKLALLTSVLRLLYAGILVIGLFALVFQMIDVYGYATTKLIGYIFFALHIFVLGISAFGSGYIPKIIGALLVIASFTYVVFFIDFHLPEMLQIMIMSIMLVAELSLSVWLLWKRNKIP